MKLLIWLFDPVIDLTLHFKLTVLKVVLLYTYLDEFPGTGELLSFDLCLAKIFALRFALFFSLELRAAEELMAAISAATSSAVDCNAEWYVRVAAQNKDTQNKDSAKKSVIAATVKCWRHGPSQCTYERHSPPGRPPIWILSGGWMPLISAMVAQCLIPFMSVTKVYNYLIIISPHLRRVCSIWHDQKP